MTSAEYLYDLRKRLRKLPPQEIDQAMSYYEEYFAEAGPEGEAEIIDRLGSPAQVASTIISDYAMKDMGGQGYEGKEGQAKGKDNTLKTMWIVILAVLASPVAIPVAAVLFCIVFALLIVLLSVFLSFFVVALTMVAGGLVGIGLGVVALFSQPVEAIAILGAALLCVSLGMALCMATIKLCQLSIKGITWIFAKLLGKKGGQR